MKKKEITYLFVLFLGWVVANIRPSTGQERNNSANQQQQQQQQKVISFFVSCFRSLFQKRWKLGGYFPTKQPRDRLSKKTG